MDNFRIEHDTMGEVYVLENALWGAQTQRSIENFQIGTEKMPLEIMYALAIIKKCAARVNHFHGLIDREKLNLIELVCDEILEKKLDNQFPLSVWQTGSGTQSNMNINEVIANRSNQLLGKSVIHPNDDVNMSQSSNDTFPTALHLSAVLEIRNRLLPAISNFKDTLIRLQKENKAVVKIGRTHLQDAVPIGFSQEISAWTQMLLKAENNITKSLDGISELAIGGTAVGTGLNAHPDFGYLIANEISQIVGFNFRTANNKYHSLSSKDDLVVSHSAIKSLAVDLLKIANDIRWYASGPRCGIGELSIPENEPGSSIMPGKVNPTQSEAMSMVVCQVMANDVSISFAASQGNFQLNVYMPLIGYNFLQSVRLLSDAMQSFNDKCLSGMKANREKMKENLDKSLMLVTALNPIIGYEKSAEIAKLAYEKNITLKEAAVELKYISEDQYNLIVNPESMI